MLWIEKNEIFKKKTLGNVEPPKYDGVWKCSGRGEKSRGDNLMTE